MKVIYPVLFYKEKENGYSVFVPDLDNASTCGSTLQEAMEMAEELIASVVLDLMEEDDKIPKADSIEKVSFEKLEKNLEIENWDYTSKFKTYIAVDISSYAEQWGKELVKKTVNIPKWINTKAEKLKINFSKNIRGSIIKENIWGIDYVIWYQNKDANAFLRFYSGFFCWRNIEKNGKYSNIIKCYKKIKKGVYGLFN